MTLHFSKVCFLMTQNSNPLPQSDRNSQLERLSILKFQSVLPTDKFVFRDERVTDAGVDGSLEILVDGQYTNMRAQVQLKSTESKKAREDGVVTYPIKTSNFNYLLNGPLGLYVLYISETDELLYEWATDENRRRIALNSEWQEQDSISIPLRLLNDTSLLDIYERISSEARLRREILEALAHAPTNDQISVTISPETLETDNSVEVENLLGSVGMTMVSAGYAEMVLEKLKLISPSATSNERLKSISAYAHYSTGRYQTALGETASVLMNSSLEEQDSIFLQRIRLACKLNLGLIDTVQYFQEVNDLTSEDELLNAEVSLQRLVISARSQDTQNTEILDEVLEITNRILSSERASDGLKICARVKFLEATGFDVAKKLSIEAIKLSARQRSKVYSSPVEQISDVTKVFDELHEWIEQIDTLTQDALDVGHPIFIADVLATKAFIKLMALIAGMSFGEINNFPMQQSSIQDESLSILEVCDISQKIYQQSEMIEGDVRVQLIMAQVFEIMGQLKAAKNLAQGVVGKAKLLGYQRHIETASEVISGETLYSKQLTAARELHSQTSKEDVDISGFSDEEDIKGFSDFMMETYRIPEERRAYVMIDALCLRDLAKEQTCWCKYVEIKQDLTHTFSPQTLYAKDPNRQVICSKFQYIVDNQSPEWIELIQDLKDSYCSTCSDREVAES